MFEQLKRPQLKAPASRRPARPPLKPATEPAMPMPSVFTRPLERPPQKKQRKACPACEESGTTCPGCQKKEAPTLERPPSETQLRGGSPGADPAERQADELGKDIGEELKGTGSVGHGPLPKGVQDVAETHLGVSLEGTYVDAGSSGQKKAKDESALAVTKGNRIAFGEGQLSTASAEGRSLLGHELVHVGQQVLASKKTTQRQAAVTGPAVAAGAEAEAAMPETHKPKGLPAKPTAVTLDYVESLIEAKPPDLGGALYVVRGRSMAQMISWLEAIKTKYPWTAAPFKAAAAGAGGPRLEIGVLLAYSPHRITKENWLAVSRMRRATRNVIVKLAEKKGVTPPCALAFPGRCHTFGEWLKTFPPPKQNEAGGYMQNITQAMPPELAEIIQGKFGPAADCADVAMILRDYYLAAQGKRQQLSKGHVLGTGSKMEIVKCMSDIGSGFFHTANAPVDYYKSGGKNVTDLQKLLKMGLKPGDVFVWKKITPGGTYAGHIQTVRSIVRSPGQPPRIVFAQGTQIGGSAPGKVYYEYHTGAAGDLTRRGSSEMALRHGVEAFYGAGPWRGPR